MRDETVSVGEATWPADALASRTPPRRRAAARLFAWLDSDTLAVLDGWLLTGLLGVYLKIALLNPQWGAVARFFGKHEPNDLGVFDRIGFFGSDLVLNLIVVPVLATALIRVVFGRFRLAAGFACAALVSVVYFVELRAGSEFGQYISRRFVRDALGWFVTNPASAGAYLTAASLLKLAALFVAMAAVVRVAGLARRAAGARYDAYRGVLALPVALLFAVTVVAAPIAYASRLPDSPLNASAVGRVVAALAAPVDALAAAHGTSLDSALDATRRLTRTSPFDPSHAFVGREAGGDLLIFMMETGPARALDYALRAAELPGARRLQPRALVASQHYSVHPYSSDAIFSVLSGLYPQGRPQLLRDVGPRPLNGLLSAQPPAVTRRGVYLPSLYQIHLDERMYGAFGATTIYIADHHPDDPLRARAEARADALLARLERGRRLDTTTRRETRAKLVTDFQAFERLQADMRAAIAAGERYAVMFFPEIGHGPWPQLRDGDTDVLARGRFLMELQDEWLLELTDVIAGAGRLERTVIAVTADHGLRTRVEYPDLPIGRISDAMFRVPLLIYAPQTLRHPVVIPAPTSHIDLAPTLLALLGEPAAVARMQGVPVWQRTPANRLYMLGSAYGGADGFLDAGRFYMRQALSGAVYANDRFVFEGAHQAQPHDPTVGFVTDALEQANQAQLAVLGRLREP
jgi:hypothetical protein